MYVYYDGIRSDPWARVEPRVGAPWMTPIPHIWIIVEIMDRVPEASFGLMKTMVLTLLGQKMITISHQYLIFKA